MATQNTTVRAQKSRHDERRVVSNIVRGSIGNLIEWYDWYAYTAFSIYFAAVFFPSGDQTAHCSTPRRCSPSAS